MIYKRITLGSGVRLLLVPITGVESVATSVMVGVGSRYEDKNINGISHFLEHMVFKGTAKYPTMDDVNIIERLGGIQNAYTDIDITNYHSKVLHTDWKLALEVNKELALAPRLEEKFIEKERSVIIEEMKRYEDEPAAKVGETFHELMFPKTKLGMRIIGTEESLRNVNSQTLHKYRDSWYASDRIVVVLAGKMDDLDAIAEIADKWFSNIKTARAEGIEVVIPLQRKPKLAIVTKPDAQQAHLTLGVPTFARGSEDRFAWSIFNLLMGVSFTSRLFKEIREKRGLCYHIRSSSDNWADAGYWSIYAGVATEKVEEAVKAIEAELIKAVEKGVSEQEVAVSKKRLHTLMAFKAEDPEFFTEYYGRQELFGQKILTVDEFLAKIDEVSPQDINKLLKKYITQKSLNMALVWNKPKEEKLEKLLKLY